MRRDGVIVSTISINILVLVLKYVLFMKKYISWNAQHVI